jgi:flagellar motor switch protein FliN
MRGEGRTGGEGTPEATDASAQDLLAALRHEEEEAHTPPAAASPAQLETMGFVLDVPVELTIELGRKHMRIGDLLRLAQGSVLELEKVNGEPLDIYANNRRIARGDAVVIGERYGVRLTEVLVVEEKAAPGERE